MTITGVSKDGQRPVVYGSFVIDADNVTVNNLEIHNKGNQNTTSDPNRNGITVASNKATITNNELVAPTNLNSGDSALSNGIVLYAGTNVGTAVTIRDNVINGYGYENVKWSSTGIIVQFGNVYGFEMTNGKPTDGKAVDLALDHSAIAKDNRYEDCYNDYLAANYATDSGNPYEYAYVSNPGGMIAGLYYAKTHGAVVELAPNTYLITRLVTHEGGETNYFVVKAGTELILPEGAQINIVEDTELVNSGTITGQERITGNIINNPSAK